MRGKSGAIALILAGVLALAINLEVIEVDLARLFRTWWPLLLIALGIGVFLAPGTDQRTKPD
ncbi:MAG TPA: DUF5668 domain-containing protein [Accumulibacter sp.]|uniref:LiaI-LiaF-like domain-containing protein n=1 Tax=Accumulibacter sp. TaxID=2053492 RepID=UPI000EE8122D|nr:DUF5668 domain-containing protein [Accumulibacter sp.]HCZ16136.1 hypothetical protein [Accumulibacter sp.]HRD93438.1 DUF5668 domain-containing protein [Accumulibacter sp.]HRF73657.1 DUF5668 domain-containing protein [Accumulibacter sp.]